MLEILKFIFTDFCHWLGSMILLAIIANALMNTKLIVINNYRYKKDKED